MNIEKLYQLLDSKLAPETQREELIAYLKSCVQSMTPNEAERAKLAYEIAGLMSTNYARSLSNDDKLGDILTIAGELEIEDPSNNDQWVELVELITGL